MRALYFLFFLVCVLILLKIKKNVSSLRKLPLYCLNSNAHVILEGVPPLVVLDDVVPSVEFIILFF